MGQLWNGASRMMVIKVNVLCVLNTTLHNWFCSIYKGSSKQNQEEEERNYGGGEKRKMTGCHRGHPTQACGK